MHITAIQKSNLEATCQVCKYERKPLYVNHFLIPGKPAMIHIHYNTGNSFFFSRFFSLPRKKPLPARVALRKTTAEKWQFRRLSVSIFFISAHYLDRNASPIRRPQPDLNPGMFVANLSFFSVRYFMDFTSKLKSELYEIPHLHNRFFLYFFSFSFSFFCFCFLYRIW